MGIDTRRSSPTRMVLYGLALYGLFAFLLLLFVLRHSRILEYHGWIAVLVLYFSIWFAPITLTVHDMFAFLGYYGGTKFSLADPGAIYQILGQLIWVAPIALVALTPMLPRGRARTLVI